MIFCLITDQNVHCEPGTKLHTFKGCWTNTGTNLHYVSVGPSGMWGKNINSDWNHWFGSYSNPAAGELLKDTLTQKYVMMFTVTKF